MNLSQLKESLALWERREDERKDLHTVAQQDLLEARAAGVTGPELDALVERRDLRSDQLSEARKNIALRERQIEELLAQQNSKSVHRPYERIKADVRNQSSRGGVSPRLIVLHSTESHNRAGLSDVQAIVSWFDNPGSGASSHVIVDDEGISGRCVPDSAKAWTQAAFNPQSLSIEMIGRAAQGKSAWTDEQIRKTAMYLAYWSEKYDIPLTRSTSRGVCRHMDLGAAGGGHHDPGFNFPIDRCIAEAKVLKREGW